MAKTRRRTPKNAAAIKVIVERHADGYIAYPLGMRGVVVGQGDTYEDALADAKSAVLFHIETFGKQAFVAEPPVLEAFVAELRLAGCAASSRSTRRKRASSVRSAHWASKSSASASTSP